MRRGVPLIPPAGGTANAAAKPGGAHVLEDQFGPVVSSIGADYVDRVMGCLASGPDLLENWKKEHRKEGKRDR